jgi:hypothetical protein
VSTAEDIWFNYIFRTIGLSIQIVYSFILFSFILSCSFSCRGWYFRHCISWRYLFCYFSALYQLWRLHLYSDILLRSISCRCYIFITLFYDAVLVELVITGYCYRVLSYKASHELRPLSDLLCVLTIPDSSTRALCIGLKAYSPKLVLCVNLIQLATFLAHKLFLWPHTVSWSTCLYAVQNCLLGWLIPDDGGSTYLWNVGRQLFYTVVHPRRQFWTSYSPPWGLEILLVYMLSN